MREYTSPSGRVVVQWSNPSLIEVHGPSASTDSDERFCGPLLARCERYGTGWLCRRFVTPEGQRVVVGRVLMAVEETPVATFAEALEWAVALADEPVAVLAEAGAR